MTYLILKNTKIGVTYHSRSSKLAPIGSLPMVSY